MDIKSARCLTKKAFGCRTRTKYTDDQVQYLERVFDETHYPDYTTLETISNKIDIPLDRLNIWFQNRRSKFKRQSKGSYVGWMRRQLFQSGSTNQKRDSHRISPPLNQRMNARTLHYFPTPVSPISSLASPRGGAADLVSPSNSIPMDPINSQALQTSASSPALHKTWYQPLDHTSLLSPSLNFLFDEETFSRNLTSAPSVPKLDKMSTSFTNVPNTVPANSKSGKCYSFPENPENKKDDTLYYGAVKSASDEHPQTDSCSDLFQQWLSLMSPSLVMDSFISRDASYWSKFPGSDRSPQGNNFSPLPEFVDSTDPSVGKKMLM